MAELKDYAKFNSVSRVLEPDLTSAEISITGKTKKADIIDAMNDHLEQAASGKKAKK